MRPRNPSASASVHLFPGAPAWFARRLAVDGVGSHPVTVKASRLAAIVGIALAAGCGLLGLWIGTDELRQLDERLFLSLNSLGSERWDGLWLVITDKLAMVPVLAAMVLLMHRRFGLKNTLAILALVTLMITMTDQLANLAKAGFERLRPCREEHLQDLIRYIAPRCGRYGFFSAHAANSVAFAVFMGLLFRRTHRHVLLLLLVLAAVVSFSRIYVGVHYPLDSLAGATVGAVAGLLVYGVALLLKLPRPR